MTKYIMVIHGTDYDSYDPPKFLKRYDLEFAKGFGMAELTNNRAEAMRFDDLDALLNTWKQIPESRPLREDGRPNRPLTAYAVSPETVDDE
jgi:hypothetical protein